MKSILFVIFLTFFVGACAHRTMPEPRYSRKPNAVQKEYQVTQKGTMFNIIKSSKGKALESYYSYHMVYGAFPLQKIIATTTETYDEGNKGDNCTITLDLIYKNVSAKEVNTTLSFETVSYDENNTCDEWAKQVGVTK